MSLIIDLSGHDLKDMPDLDASACHAMPCNIHYSGPCNTATYFTPNVKETDEKDGVKCSFRGYPLHGQKISVPAGYKGYVIKEGLCHGDNRQLNIVSTISGFTAWNYDQIPSQSDTFVKAADWIDVASAIHKKVTSSS